MYLKGPDTGKLQLEAYFNLREKIKNFKDMPLIGLLIQLVNWYFYFDSSY